jgi:hypothetical protein
MHRFAVTPTIFVKRLSLGTDADSGSVNIGMETEIELSVNTGCFDM